MAPFSSPLIIKQPFLRGRERPLPSLRFLVTSSSIAPIFATVDMGDCSHHHFSLTIDTLSLPSPSLPSPPCPVPSFSSTPLLSHHNPLSSSNVDGLISPHILASNRILICGNCEPPSAYPNAATALAECRICQEEEDIANLESPCACAGSLKYVHRKCVQRWCNEKGDTTCEICQQSYKHGYTAPPPPPHSPDDLSLDFSDEWNSHTIELHDSRLLAMAAAQRRRFLDAQYEEANSSSAACCRSAALILMALLLLRHAIAMAAATVDEDASMFLSLFVLRAAGFLLPCYIMARAMNMLQRRRHRQEADMAGAAEVSIFVQAGQSRGVRLSLTSTPSET